LLAAIHHHISAAKAWLDTAKTLAETLKTLVRTLSQPSQASSRRSAAAAARQQQQSASLVNPEIYSVVLQARAHLEAAAQLRVDVSNEAEQLSEAAKSYCVCQSLYDEVRPMLGCDHCSDWFHWECVGLEAPRDDQDDAELVPHDYR
jgi:hypothetical protein